MLRQYLMGWTGFVCIVLPSKPVVVDGKTLDEGSIKATKF